MFLTSGSQRDRTVRVMCALRIVCFFYYGRWSRFHNFLRALRVLVATLRTSQKCFRLNLYTNLPIGGIKVRKLIQAGGAGVEVRALLKLPASQYTG